MLEHRTTVKHRKRSPAACSETSILFPRTALKNIATAAVLVGLGLLLSLRGSAQPAAFPMGNPILFVTQMPIPFDGTTIGSIFGNHLTETARVGRGGDLYLLYPDGALRNLTREAGYGNDGFQGASSIAVRSPCVHWSGTKALFSMVIGAPTGPEQEIRTWWQIYEVTGLAQGQSSEINRVAKQPGMTNNISPIYGSDGRIIFVSDRSRTGEPHLYPQLDEYDSFGSNTGLWSLDPASGELDLIENAPSGAFTPILDSYGRVIFTRWDHLTRDKQAMDDRRGLADFGTFNYSDESPSAMALSSREEVFPEPLNEDTELLAGTNLIGHDFNTFLPWQINQDGTAVETLNHVGRHELFVGVPPVFKDDPNLVERFAPDVGFNFTDTGNLVQLRESQVSPGTFFGVDSVYDGTHTAGRIFSIEGSPTLPADEMELKDVTRRETSGPVGDGAPVPPGHTGIYRHPLPLADGGLLVVHTANSGPDRNVGSPEQPEPLYHFRLTSMVNDGAYLMAGSPLTPGIRKDLTYWNEEGFFVEYSGDLWELEPVEVVARPVPPYPTGELPSIEETVFEQEGVELGEFRDYLVEHDLALIVSRNVTTRDAADRQQPFNLRVAGTSTQTLGAGGKIYDIAHLQLFQGDLIRGLGGPQDPFPGRRILAQAMHDPQAINPPNPAGPAGSVRLGADGSMAALVPAHRAMSWQLTDEAGTPVVRERYWLDFQPGEIRVCTSCHGLNSVDQAGNPAPTNAPQALRDLLQFWKDETGGGGGAGGCVADTTTLCLNNERFAVEVSWRDHSGRTGVGQSVGFSGEAGMFWFFNAANLEMLVKVVDGCGFNDRYWVFAGAITDVAYTLKVTDTATGEVREYSNPLGKAAPAVTDTEAFSTCP